MAEANRCGGCLEYAGSCLCYEANPDDDEATSDDFAGEREIEERVWCFNANAGKCPSELGSPGFVGSGEADLCAACEAERASK